MNSAKKQDCFGTSEADKIENCFNPHPCFFRDFANYILHNTIFTQLTVLDTVAIPHNKTYSLILRKFYRISFQLVWASLDKNSFKNLQNHFTDL